MTLRHFTKKTARAAARGGAVAVGGLALAGGVAILTYPRWRTRCLTWGATTDEAEATLPGDDLLVDPDLVATRATWVDAPPSAIWPWLAQMGSGRGGVYTYDWIENVMGLHMHSVDEVLPQFQDIKVGDAQKLGKNGPTLRVAICEPGETLVFQSDDGNWVWAFIMQADASGTRLVSRNRIKTPGASVAARFFYRYLMEPGSLVMERKMLLGIKARSERLAKSAQAAPRATVASA
jgi:hypothetical protein